MNLYNHSDLEQHRLIIEVEISRLEDKHSLFIHSILKFLKQKLDGCEIHSFKAWMMGDFMTLGSGDTVRVYLYFDDPNDRVMAKMLLS